MKNLKTAAAVCLGFLLGLAVANLVPGAVVIAQDVAPAAVADTPDAAGLPSIEIISTQLPLQNLAGGTCSDGQTCANDAECGECEGLNCVCLGITCKGRCACP